MPNPKITVVFQQERETKNTVVFQEQTESSSTIPMVGKLYLRKEGVKVLGNPGSLVVTIEAGD